MSNPIQNINISQYTSVSASNKLKLHKELIASVTPNTSKSHNSVGFGSLENPNKLVYKAAIDKINEVLEPIKGSNALQNEMDSMVDYSPEATASRIVSLATGFYDAYQKTHPDNDREQGLKNFMETIGKGINQGFSEAKEILQGLGVLQGDIADNIDRTYELVQEGLEEFESDKLNYP